MDATGYGYSYDNSVLLFSQTQIRTLTEHLTDRVVYQLKSNIKQNNFYEQTREKELKTKLCFKIPNVKYMMKFITQLRNNNAR